MNTVTDLPSLRALVREARSRGASIGFVPTMGALHEGHLSLVRLARKACGLTVVSIFVNPLQFSPGEDFERYPRREEEDAALLASAGAELLYIPAVKDFYPPDFSTAIEVAGVSAGGEGAARGPLSRRRHGRRELLLQIQPDAAYFGQKDLQQVAVIRGMARDLTSRSRSRVGPTIREPDGLALSSRNAYLAGRAPALPGAGGALRRAAAGGRRRARCRAAGGRHVPRPCRGGARGGLCRGRVAGDVRPPAPGRGGRGALRGGPRGEDAPDRQRSPP